MAPFSSGHISTVVGYGPALSGIGLRATPVLLPYEGGYVGQVPTLALHAGRWCRSRVRIDADARRLKEKGDLRSSQCGRGDAER